MPWRPHKGVVYTPPDLALEVARLVLDPMAGALRVLDPACGDGALLRAAQQVVGSRAQLVGVDLALAMEPAPGLDVVQGDALGGDDGAVDWDAPPLAGPFDAVLANPPYLRHARIGAKAHLRRFAVYHGAADLYVYFFELGLSRLRPGGRMGVIVSNKWLRAGYAAPLRRYLARQAEVERVVDYGHAPVFRGVDAFPSVVILRRRAEGATIGVPGAPQVAKRDAWLTGPSPVLEVLESLKGRPLAEVAGPARRGVVTGANRAFVVDRPTRDALVAADPQAADLLVPWLRGRDLQAWQPAPAERWLLAVRQGTDLRGQRAVMEHLSRFREALEPRRPGEAGPGRKPGRYRWYELQDRCAFWPLMRQPKIAWPDLAWRPAFALDAAGHALANTAYFLPTADPWLLAVLNSPVAWSWLWHHAQHGKDETLRLFSPVMQALPVPPPPAGVDVASLVAARDEARLSGLVARAWGLDERALALLRRAAPPRSPPWPTLG